MSGPIFWLPKVKMSWEKNSKKKPMLLINFCFMIHFDFYNTKIFSFSIGSKVMNHKMPLWILSSSSSFTKDMITSMPGISYLWCPN